MTDLTPLERAAGRAGLPGLRARLVPPGRRRGRWFAWGQGELLVSERIVERLAPEDAVALLLDEIFCRRRRRRALRLLGAAGLGALAALLLQARLWPPLRGELVLAAAAGLLVAAALAWGRTALAADDETVALLGQADALVRGLNGMNVEELHLGVALVAARPDLHRRAERLVRKHGLCAKAAP